MKILNVAGKVQATTATINATAETLFSISPSQFLILGGPRMTRMTRKLRNSTFDV